MLPVITGRKSTFKYNQIRASIAAKYSIKLPKHVGHDTTTYNFKDSEQRSKHNLIGGGSMKKLKKRQLISERERENNKQNSIRWSDQVNESYTQPKSFRKYGKNENTETHHGNGDIQLSSKRINTKEKPPHRYKTTMVVFKHCLLLYGGLGCEKNLTWGRLDFQSMNWSRDFTNQHKSVSQYTLYSSPIYGHSMCQYRDLAIIYGGSSHDDMNQTTIINSKTMKLTQGSRCPLRRREHAAVVIGDLMFVHGGIEARETKSEMFAYNITQDKWIGTMGTSGLPALSSHKMVKGKNNRQIFIFGGLNAKSRSVNKMYRIRIINMDTLQIKVQPIDCLNAPLPRHSFCLEKISPNNIILYGGREDNETDSEDQAIQSGVFSDVHLFNIDSKMWKRVFLNQGFDSCFGMASTSLNGAVFIFGGSKKSQYADAGITIIWNSEDIADPWDCVKTSEYEVLESKKNISFKFIHF